MPRCEHCGKDFGNAGAKASHQNACDQKAQTETAAPAEKAEPQQAQADVPARQMQDGQSQALEVGGQVGSVVSGLTSSNPERKARAESEAITLVSSGLAKLGQEAAKKRLQNMNNAKNTNELRATNNYPNCPECGNEIHEVPNAPEFPCPECNTMLETA